MEFVQLIEKTTRRLNLIFRNVFGTSCDPQKGYASTFTDFIEISRDESPPVMDGYIEIDTNGSPVIDQLWGAVGEVMSYTSILVELLFNNFGVTAQEQSPFCPIFSSPTDLRDEFIAYLPRKVSFGDASGNAEPSNINDEARDAPATSPETIVLEQVRIFAEKILRDDAKSDEDSDGENIEVVSNCDNIQIVSPSLSSSLLASSLRIFSAKILTCSSTIASGEVVGASQASYFVLLGSAVPLASPKETFLGRYTMNSSRKSVGDENMGQNGDCSCAVTPKLLNRSSTSIEVKT